MKILKHLVHDTKILTKVLRSLKYVLHHSSSALWSESISGRGPPSPNISCFLEALSSVRVESPMGESLVSVIGESLMGLARSASVLGVTLALLTLPAFWGVPSLTLWNKMWQFILSKELSGNHILTERGGEDRLTLTRWWWNLSWMWNRQLSTEYSVASYNMPQEIKTNINTCCNHCKTSSTYNFGIRVTLSYKYKKNSSINYLNLDSWRRPG